MAEPMDLDALRTSWANVMNAGLEDCAGDAMSCIRAIPALLDRLVAVEREREKAFEAVAAPKGYLVVSRDRWNERNRLTAKLDAALAEVARLQEEYDKLNSEFNGAVYAASEPVIQQNARLRAALMDHICGGCLNRWCEAHRAYHCAEIDAALDGGGENFNTEDAK
jgi:hypothetical protein